MEQWITTGQFVEMLAKRAYPGSCPEERLIKSREDGWTEEQDAIYREQYIERRAVARILHQFIRMVQKEPELKEWKMAHRLKDLYDCRICVNHVAQVYCKGILPGMQAEDGSLIFGMREQLTLTEAQMAVERIWKPELRCSPEKHAAAEKNDETGQCAEQPKTEPAGNLIKRLDCAQAERQIAEYRRKQNTFLLLDVRSVSAYEKGHINGAVSIPLIRLLEKKELHIPEKLPILIYCENGHESMMAAEYFAEAGYTDVVCFAWKTQDNASYAKNLGNEEL